MLDRVSFHTFQPLLYQVATAMLEPDAVAYSFRQIFKKQHNFHFRLVEVKRIDPEQKRVKTTAGCLAYDSLVIATGASTNCYGMQDIAKHALLVPQIAGIAANLLMEVTVILGKIPGKRLHHLALPLADILCKTDFFADNLVAEPCFFLIDFPCVALSNATNLWPIPNLP